MSASGSTNVRAWSSVQLSVPRRSATRSSTTASISCSGNATAPLSRLKPANLQAAAEAGAEVAHQERSREDRQPGGHPFRGVLVREDRHDEKNHGYEQQDRSQAEFHSRPPS